MRGSGEGASGTVKILKLIWKCSLLGTWNLGILPIYRLGNLGALVLIYQYVEHRSNSTKNEVKKMTKNIENIKYKIYIF